MKTRQKGFFYRAPRALGIGMIFFLALFSFDVFDMEGTLWEKIGGFLIHNIPSFILILLLVISWRREWMGAFGFTILGLAFSLANLNAHWSEHALISAPLILIGLLFLISWQRARRAVTQGQSGGSAVG